MKLIWEGERNDLIEERGRNKGLIGGDTNESKKEGNLKQRTFETEGKENGRKGRRNGRTRKKRDN